MHRKVAIEMMMSFHFVALVIVCLKEMLNKTLDVSFFLSDTVTNESYMVSFLFSLSIFRDCREGLVVRALSNFAENLVSVPNTYITELITTCNSSSTFSDSFPLASKSTSQS